ncbi:Protein of unknown function DUF1997 [Dillenia turbinata]|uniref:Uncharacterized protein n=1 Tax=Dillenia turbinata TaxID=194707 RepID=A0AAN8YUW1_9MAGN
MGEIVARNSFLPHRSHSISGVERRGLLMRQNSQARIVNKLTTNLRKLTSKMSTDIPIYELPGASFDHYLEDKPRVFKAIFPDKPRSQQLNEEEWRIQMLPIHFLFLTVRPVVDLRLRCKSEGKDYPPQVPFDVTKLIELDITRWELKGLESMFKPTNFVLGVNGILYPDRRQARTRLKGQLEMSISASLPPVLAMVNDRVLQGVAESVLEGLLQNMKNKVNGSLLADYGKFKMEMSSRK